MALATLPFSTPSSLPTLTNPIPTNHHPTSFSAFSSHPFPRARACARALICAYKVRIEHQGQSTELDVDGDETILSKALDSGLDIPHDCKLGVCMTCPAKLLTGQVDQSEGMLSDDVVDRGYALLCVAYPRSDCSISTIPEEELLSLQLATAND